MLRINQLKLPIEHSEWDLENKICKTLRIQPEQVISYQICKKSIDARKKQELSFVYAVDVAVVNEEKFLRRNKNRNINKVLDKQYSFPNPGEEKLASRPVIIGSGPAGLFCAYELALHGYCPVVLERGMDVKRRTKEVERFLAGWELEYEDECSVRRRRSRHFFRRKTKYACQRCGRT